MAKTVKLIYARIRDVGAKPRTWNEDFIDEDTGELVSIPRTEEAGWIEEFRLVSDTTPRKVLDSTIKEFNASVRPHEKLREWVYFRRKGSKKKWFNKNIK